MAESLYSGVDIREGVAKEGSTLGKNYIEAVRGFLECAVPLLYPKLSLGARPLKGNEAEEVLKAANVSALPQVFYGADGGTDLIVPSNGKILPNREAEIAREVLSFVRRQHTYGNRVTGKDLEAHFQAMPCGWEYEMVLLVLAVLLRDGSIELTYQERRFRNHLDPQTRAPFSQKAWQAFRASSLAPRQSIELKTLTEAVKRYEELTGQEVDVEESAIAAAAKKLAADELAGLVPLEAHLTANRLPPVEVLSEYRAQLQTLVASASDDCVRILAEEGVSSKAQWNQVRRLRDATVDDGLRLFRTPRQALGGMWPELVSRPGGENNLDA